MTRYSTAAMAAVLLAGCGGGSGSGGDATGIGPDDATGGPPVVASAEPVTQSVGQLPTSLSVTYDPAADTVTVDDGTGPVTLPYVLTQGTTGTTGRFYYYGTSTTDYVVRQETASGSGLATFVYRLGSGQAGTFTSRLSDTEMPTSGSAEFAGTYIGGVFDPGAQMEILIQRGDVALGADFGAATISGDITNRTGGGLNMAPVVLAETRISDGAFTGTTSGGAVEEWILPTFTIPGTTAATGSYAGLFTGVAGEEIVGSIEIPHVRSGRPLTEYGAFVAGRTGQ